MNVQPVRKYLVVDNTPESEKTTEMGIVVPYATSQLRIAKVLSVGPDVEVAQPGDSVLFNRHSGKGHEGICLLHNDDVLAKVSE